MFDIYKVAVDAARRVVATDIRQPGVMTEDILRNACNILWRDFLKGHDDDHE
jgi:hypothetical protein